MSVPSRLTACQGRATSAKPNCFIRYVLLCRWLKHINVPIQWNVPSSLEKEEAAKTVMLSSNEWLLQVMQECVTNFHTRSGLQKCSSFERFSRSILVFLTLRPRRYIWGSFSSILITNHTQVLPTSFALHLLMPASTSTRMSESVRVVFARFLRLLVDVLTPAGYFI